MQKAIVFLLLLVSSCIGEEVKPKKGPYFADPNPNYFDWKNYFWIKRQTSGKEGPGPNYWSGNNLIVPSNPNDPLTMVISTEGGRHYCSEMYMNEALGYGTYQFDIHQKVEDIANVDPRVVFGFFLYKNDEYEYDIEIAKWGIDRPNAYNMDYITQPHIEGRTGVTFLLPFGHQRTRHIFEWQPDIIYWKTLDLDTGEILYQYNTREQVRREDPGFVLHINFWMHEGFTPRVPTQTITIDDFKFYKYRGEKKEETQ